MPKAKTNTPVVIRLLEAQRRGDYAQMERIRDANRHRMVAVANEVNAEIRRRAENN